MSIWRISTVLLPDPDVMDDNIVHLSVTVYLYSFINQVISAVERSSVAAMKRKLWEQRLHPQGNQRLRTGR